MATSLTRNLTLRAAEAALAAAQTRARELGVPMNIAVVDTSLYLLAFARMPGAKLTSVDIAVNKAFTAAGHRAPTDSYRDKAQVSGGAMVGVHSSNGGRFTTIGGGLPIVLPGGEGGEAGGEGVVVGAIGCSTGTPDQDTLVAQAGVDAIRRMARAEGDGKVRAKL